MKLTSLFLALFFALSLVDFPAAVSQPGAAKSCCCSANKVCRCQHGTQTFCPMKRMKDRIAKENAHQGCAMMRQKKQAEAEAVQRFLKEIEERGYPLFQAMGCGSAEEHKAAPSYSRDFNIYPAPNQMVPKKPEFFWTSNTLDPFQLFSYPLEKPPQLTFSF